MPVLSHLSAEARAECFGEIPWGGLPAVATKHGLTAARLHDARYRHHGRRPPKSERRIGLPAAGCRGWSVRRKQAVVVALRRGEITEAEVLERYAMAPEELAAWRAAYADASAAGLEAVTPRRVA